MEQINAPETENKKPSVEQKSLGPVTPSRPFRESPPPGRLDLGGGWGSEHIPTEIIAKLKDAAMKEAKRLGLHASTVPDMMQDLDWKTDLDTLREKLRDRMIEASDPGLEALYKVMCTVLEKPNPQNRPLP